jgi:hypothetical protein
MSPNRRVCYCNIGNPHTQNNHTQCMSLHMHMQYGEERILVEMPQFNSTVRALLSAAKMKLPECVMDGLLTWDGCEMDENDRYLCVCVGVRVWLMLCICVNFILFLQCAYVCV